jgi:hypothetical protein
MRLGPSQMTDFIGAGGMGEVYRARDTHRRARHASSDENRWAHSYPRSSQHVLSMQSEVAAAVAEAVNRVLMANAVTPAAPAHV